MALTGQLNDLSLAELIEFFCNQRKTGRLKVAYPQVPGIFHIKDGELVDARVGALAGVEAVYYALRQPNARFDFQPQQEAAERTIHEPWAQVVLEGLRRLDEGIPVGDPLAGLTEEEIARLREENEADAASENISFAMVASGDGRRRAMGLGVAAVALLICATAVGALTDWFGLKRANTASAAPSSRSRRPRPPSRRRCNRTPRRNAQQRTRPKRARWSLRAANASGPSASAVRLKRARAKHSLLKRRRSRRLLAGRR